ERNIEFKYHIDDSLDFIFSDKDRISQIIKNLLSNAVKFTEKGQVKFLVFDEEPNVKIVVEDDGIGISKDKLEHIFDRFKQVDGSTTRKYGGTGLGLAICKELSKLLEGDVFVESEVDKGSTFTLVIPKNKHLLEGMNFLEISSNKEDLLELNSKEEIIVLNNDPIVFFNLVIELNKKYKVIQAFSFDELKTFIERKEKIIIDIDNLPKDEIEFLIANFEGKLIFISENELEDEYKKQVFDFVKKPLTEELIAKI
ncbi:MAG: ATP-binding protein, partial [Halarcobacter sp.]